QERAVGTTARARTGTRSTEDAGDHLVQHSGTESNESTGRDAAAVVEDTNNQTALRFVFEVLDYALSTTGGAVSTSGEEEQDYTTRTTGPLRRSKNNYTAGARGEYSTTERTAKQLASRVVAAALEDEDLPGVDQSRHDKDDISSLPFTEDLKILPRRADADHRSRRNNFKPDTSTTWKTELVEFLDLEEVEAQASSSAASSSSAVHHLASSSSNRAGAAAIPHDKFSQSFVHALLDEVLDPEKTNLEQLTQKVERQNRNSSTSTVLRKNNNGSGKTTTTPTLTHHLHRHPAQEEKTVAGISAPESSLQPGNENDFAIKASLTIANLQLLSLSTSTPSGSNDVLPQRTSTLPPIMTTTTKINRFAQFWPLTERYNPQIYIELCGLALRDERFFQLFQNAKSFGKEVDMKMMIDDRTTGTRTTGTGMGGTGTIGRGGKNPTAFLSHTAGAQQGDEEIGNPLILQLLQEERGGGHQQQKIMSPSSSASGNIKKMNIFEKLNFPPNPRQQHFDTLRKNRRHALRRKKGLPSETPPSHSLTGSDV
ncbi:unnamed protein product, partial [Amoebophrya sp. A120]